MPPSDLISVAVPVPFLDRLTYRVPDGVEPPKPGARVVVPLGPRTLTGCVVPFSSSGDEPAADREIKPLVEVLDREPFLPPSIVKLALWVADYYAAAPGEAIAAALPPLALRGRARAHKTIGIATLTADGQAVAAQVGEGEAPARLRLGPRPIETLLALRGAPDGLPTADLRARGITAAVLQRMAGMGLVHLRRARIERDPFATGRPAGPTDARSLTDEQATALARLCALAAAGRFKAALLHGVTGSGKTEIYLRLAEQTRRQGRGVLMLVPEIALTPAVAAAFRGAFADRVAIQHSGLSDGERHDQWHRIRRGEIDVVVGTRSAVFAPLPSIGSIIVDEEHDGSYKQEESPRYNARDVAVMRGREEQALVVLGSATPSMESYQNALAGRYERISLERRVLDRPLADVRVVNMREEYAARGPETIVSEPLRLALADRLARREQALILLNRRGLASSVFCRQCGGTIDCPNCSVSLTVHSRSGPKGPPLGETGSRRERRARCHYCNYSSAVPKSCPLCAGPYLELTGIGTERVEAEIASLLPAARVARLDRDAVRRRGAAASLLERFARAEIDVLVGTQMIAKGHDFPGVTLVGVISADVGLGLADFRAAERTFQLLTQVAGRAGRGEKTGEALIQTVYPDHYSIRHACRQDYGAFFEDEIRYRRAMRYPPAVALVNAVVRGPSFARAMEMAADLAEDLRAESRRQGAFRVLGPAPAPLEKLRGEHRAQLFLKGPHRSTMREALVAALRARPKLRRQVSIDVDPMTVL